jgi:hypothetical protein
MQQLGSHWPDLREILYCEFLTKSVGNVQISLKSDKKQQICYMKTHVHLQKNLSVSETNARNTADINMTPHGWDLHAGYLGRKIHTYIIFNIYCLMLEFNK